ncbi:hypothetical protein [Hymenobacter sp. UYCo722]|uniref:hypothetical protein n=1 Tax=Hymenobacter sp. UYCo722 TaxID=3156335 RepID=UPI003397B9C7
MRRVLLLLFGAWLPSCAGSATREKTIVFPCHYVGWVNLIYELPGESRAERTAATDRYELAGDLTRCGVPLSFAPGAYRVKLLYNCQGALVEIPSFVDENAHVSRSYVREMTVNGHEKTVQSFYLSATPLARSLPDDALPPNPMEPMPFSSQQTRP